MGVIAWIVFGLIAGALARVILPGKQPGGLIVTVGLGIAGAVTGGLIASLLGAGGVTGFNLPSLLIAIAGAVLLLVIYEAIAGFGCGPPGMSNSPGRTTSTMEGWPL